MTTRKGFTEKENTVLSYSIETAQGSDTFQAFNPPEGFNPQRASVALAKPVDLNYPMGNGNFDLNKYGTISPLPSGFKFCEFFRRSDQPVSAALMQQQLVMWLSLTEEERNDANVRKNAYVEIGGNSLNHTALGDLQHHPQFVLNDVSKVVESLHQHWDGRYSDVDRIGFNFETTYAPPYDSWNSVLYFLGANAATISIVCEWGPIKGQTKTLLELWNGNMFQGEIAQRMVNRHVALLLYVKSRVAATTLVANSDGTMCYYQTLPHNDDYFDSRDDLSGGASYYNYFWDTPSNFDPFTVGEPNTPQFTISNQGGKRYWDLADFMNMYRYPYWGKLEPGDYDSMINGAVDYPTLWAAAKPSEEYLDVALPTWFDTNQRKLASIGRPDVPVCHQTHYRYEGGYQRGNNNDINSKAWGLDEAVAPPAHNHLIGLLAIMCAKVRKSHFLSWSTVKSWPNSTWNNAINSTRPQGDRLAYRAAMLAMAKFREYFEENTQVIYRAFVRYPGLAGGNWGAGVVDGGDGFYQRKPRDIAKSGNPSDPRTKVNVTIRIREKNGAKWALILATNMRLTSTSQTSNFDLRFRPAEVPGLSTTVDITGLSITGYWGYFLREVCLEPAKLGTVTGDPITTPPTPTPPTTPTTPTLSAPPFLQVETTADSWGVEDMQVLDNGIIRAGFRKSVGATLCHFQRKSDGVGLVNDFKVTKNGQTVSDKGRQGGVDSDYGTPRKNYVQGGNNTNMTGNDTGMNFVQGGNRNTEPDPNNVWNQGSPILIFEKREIEGKGTGIYVKLNPLQWAIPSNSGPMEHITEFWAWLEGIALRFYVRMTNTRTDNQRTWESCEQERPYFYAIATLFRHFIYTGTAPYTNDPALTEITLDDPATITSGDKEKHGSPRLASEHWIMALDGAGAKGVGIWTPWNTRFIDKQFQSRSGNEDSNDSSYINAAPIADSDNNQITDYEAAFIAGTKAEIRNWINGQPRLTHFTFPFGYSNAGWWTINAPMRLQAGVVTIDFGKPNNDNSKINGKFGSPFRAWPASELGTIYLKGAFQGVSKMGLAFTKPGLDDGNIAGRKDFEVIGDGVERTYTVNLAGTSNFTGIITSIQLVHASSTTNNQLIGDVWFKPVTISNQPIDTEGGSSTPTTPTSPASSISRMGHHYDSNTDALEIVGAVTDSRTYQAAIYAPGTSENQIVWRSMTPGSYSYGGQSWALSTATILGIGAGTYILAIQPLNASSERVTRTVTYGNTNVEGVL